MSGPSTHEYPRCRWVVFCLVFYGIPLFLVCAFANQVWMQRAAARQIRLEQRLERTLSALEAWKDTKSFMAHLFDIVQERIGRSADPDRTRRLLVGHLLLRFPGTLTVTSINAQGDVIPDATTWKPPRVVLRRLSADYRRNLAGDDSGWKKNWSMYVAFLGSLVRYREKMHGSVMLSSYAPERAFVYMSKPSDQGMMIVHFAQSNDFEVLAMRDRARAINRATRGIRVGMVDIEQNMDKVRDFGQRIPELGQVVARFESSPLSMMRFASRIWAHRLVSPTCRLLAMASDRQDTTVDQPRLQLVALVTLVFAVLAIVTWWVTMGRWTIYLSIRIKLLALFLYMVGLPLTVMAINAYNHFGERRSGLENQVHLDMERALQMFDQRFPLGVGEMQAQLLRVLRAPIKEGADYLAVTRKRLNWLLARMTPSVVQLFDQRGRSLFQDGAPAQRGAMISLSDIKTLYVNLLRCLNGQTVAADDVGMADALPDAPGKGGVDISMFMGDIARGINKLTEFKIGDNRTLQGLYPLLDAQGVARFLAVIGWGRSKVEHYYTQRHLKPSQKRLENTFLFAFNRPDEKRNVPLTSRWRPRIGDFLEKLAAQTQTMRGRIVRGDTTWLLTGIRCRELADFCLVAITADHAIRSEVGGLRMRLGIMSLAMLLMGVSVGNLLARKFLEPVGHLTLGVAALQSRRFDRRIVVLDRDELGDLSTTFNGMMDGMADLEVGRIVQESLFPQDTLAVGSTAAYGSCVPASQMGGDYYDYFPMGSDRMALLIGDVSGHGVASAMVMAMAKAVVAHMSETEIDPAKVLASLNSVILRNLKRSRMMSCFFALIDVTTPRITFCNAGHNYPYLLRDGTITAIEMTNYPLGMSARPKFANGELALQAGDLLLFYTDGLIEAIARDGEQIGYERLLAALPGFRGDTPLATERAIRTWFDRMAQPGPQADDITVVVVQLGSAGITVARA